MIVCTDTCKACTTHVASRTHQSDGVPISEMWKLRPGEAKQIAQGHAARICGEILFPRVGVLKPGCTVESPRKS